MIRKSAVFYSTGSSDYKALFLICSAFFAVGALMGLASGSFLANGSQVTQNGSFNLLFGYINGNNIKFQSLLNSFISASCFCISAFVLAFFVFGYFFIPFISLIKGYFLSFFSAALISAYGAGGVWISLICCLSDIFICIPCLLAYSALCMDSSSRLTQIVFNGKNIRPFTGGFFVVSVIALVLLILASALKCYLIPQIISLIS